MGFLLSLAFVGIAAAQAPAAALRIVVIEGEDAVNVVQQKTAVRPLVEVRDRNNLPVPGATVTFTIANGQPAVFAGGAPTVTVTTNASGQAAATGFNATGAGKVTIQVQAAHQGQMASLAITQTNFLTAAAATAAGAGGSAAGGGVASGGATGGAAGGAGGAAAGGGLSMTTIGIIGAAVAGGAVAATQVGGSQETETRTYTTQFEGQMTVTTTTVGSGICVSTRAVSGTVSFSFPGDGPKAQLDLRAPQIAMSDGLTCPPSLQPTMAGQPTVTGSASNLAFSMQTGPGTGEGAQARQTAEFSGSQAGDVINGTLTYTEVWSGSSPGRPANVVSGGGTISFQLTLR